MQKADHYKKLEWMYLHEAPINEFYKPQISIEKGHSEIRIKSDPRFFHSANAVHGSVYFKMLDDAAFFAVNSLIEDAFVLTTAFNLYFLRPVVYGQLKAVGKVTFTTKKSFLAEAILYNEKENEIARGSGTFVKSNIALDERVGYKI